MFRLLPHNKSLESIKSQIKNDFRGSVGINLSGFNLRTADFSYSYFSNANLYGTNLEGSNLTGANLTGADLRSAKLNNSNLIFVNLYGSDLKGAELSGAKLNNANLTDAKNLTNKQIKSACNWENAYFARSWDYGKGEWIVDEEKEEAKIKEIKNDKASDPKEKPNCNYWKN